MEETTKEKIAREWKRQIGREKKVAQDKKETYQQPTFSIFLSSTSMQAMIAMGRLENPLTKKTGTNYTQARFLIDTLEIIKEKTKNNINLWEKNLLDDSLFNLKIMYLEVKK